MLKNTLLVAASICFLMACNSAEPAVEDDDSITAIPDDNYIQPALEDTSTKTVVAAPVSQAEQLAAQDTLFDDGSIPTSWANAGFEDPAGFKNFIIQFKEWVKNDNTDSISAHIRFPIKPAKTAVIFKEKYAGIFNDKMKTTVAGQRLDRIFRNSNGAMIGSGQIWFAVVDGKYVVTAVNMEN